MYSYVRNMSMRQSELFRSNTVTINTYKCNKNKRWNSSRRRQGRLHRAKNKNKVEIKGEKKRKVEKEKEVWRLISGSVSHHRERENPVMEKFAHGNWIGWLLARGGGGLGWRRPPGHRRRETDINFSVTERNMYKGDRGGEEKEPGESCICIYGTLYVARCYCRSLQYWLLYYFFSFSCYFFVFVSYSRFVLFDIVYSWSL